MENLIGRQRLMTAAEVEGLGKGFSVRPAMKIEKKVSCTRCNATFRLDENRLPAKEYYCPHCIQFGRVTSRYFLVSRPAEHRSPRQVNFTWTGQLTKAQQKVSAQVVENFNRQQNTLIWAVTGSGKTEMIFAVINQCLSQGGRAAIASPRIDVCRELFPRIEAVFPTENVLLLYGDSAEKYRYSELTICTTHQLLNFYQAFDLLIIDEIDAFPYEGDPILAFAQKQALKPKGQRIYLTATPPEHLLRSIAGSFCIEKLPLRFHQRPLISPRLIWYEKWQYCYQSKRKCRLLVQQLKQLLKDNHVLLFCPSIVFMKKLFSRLQRCFTEIAMEQVCSQDAAREEKVERMRQGKYDLLLTTTILERGVTFEKISVIVIGANHEVFSKSALVQIAGRVDRKGEFTRGQVLFFYDQQTTAIRQACQEIRQMNELARRWGKDEV